MRAADGVANRTRTRALDSPDVPGPGDPHGALEFALPAPLDVLDVRLLGALRAARRPERCDLRDCHGHRPQRYDHSHGPWRSRGAVGGRRARVETSARRRLPTARRATVAGARGAPARLGR